MSAIDLNYFETYAYQHGLSISSDLARVEAVTAFYERAVLVGDEHVYSDPYLVVQLVSGAQGICFLHLEDLDFSHLEGIAGKHVLDALPHAVPYVKVALLDALFYHLNMQDEIAPTETYTILGKGSEKSQQRARRIVDLAEIGSEMRVGLVGLVVDIMRAAIERGGVVRVADLAEAGTTVMGLPVEHDARPIVEWADVVIMTGNTLKTDTLDELMRLAGAGSRRVLVYSMTGHNIAPRYVSLGADIVTCEGFPFYWYANLPCLMDVYRKTDQKSDEHQITSRIREEAITEGT